MDSTTTTERLDALEARTNEVQDKLRRLAEGMDSIDRRIGEILDRLTGEGVR